MAWERGRSSYGHIRAVSPRRGLIIHPPEKQKHFAVNSGAVKRKVGSTELGHARRGETKQESDPRWGPRSRLQGWAFVLGELGSHGRGREGAEGQL